MDCKSILEKYNWEYGEKFKSKMISFIIETMGEDGKYYFGSLYDKGEEFLSINNLLENCDDQVAFLDKNKNIYDGYVKSCSTLDAKNYPEVHEFIKERMQFMITYSILINIVIIAIIKHMCLYNGIVCKIDKLTDIYVIYNIEKYGKDAEEIFAYEYNRIKNDEEYYNEIMDIINKTGLLTSSDNN